MSTFVGVVKKNDLEGGFWELHTQEGDRYQLQGGDSNLRVEGQKVAVEGRVDTGSMGIGMVGGGILKVSSWKPAS